MTTNTNSLIVTMAAELLAEEEIDLDAKWDAFDKRAKTIEDKFIPALQKMFTKQETAVLAKLRRTPVPEIRPSEKVVHVGDKVVFPWTRHSLYPDGCGVIKELFSGYAVVSLYEKLNYTFRVPFGDIVLLKGSEEAEAASEAYVDAIYTASAWQKPFEAMALPFVALAYKEAGAAAYTEIGFGASFNVTNPRARKFLKDKVFKFSEEVNATTREKIRKALVKGLDGGESVRDISQRIADVYDINRGTRTDMIAQTEIVGASNNGTHAGYVESEIVLTKIWIDSRDDRVRDSHRIDGQERKLNERYSNGLLHPHDPDGPPEEVIRCRCTEAAGKLKEAV